MALIVHDTTCYITMHDLSEYVLMSYIDNKNNTDLQSDSDV